MLEFHLVIYDDETASRVGIPGQVSFNLDGLNAREAAAAVPLLEKFTDKMKIFVATPREREGDPVQKYGAAEPIIPEPDDDPQEAQEHWDDQDREELVREMDI